MFGQNNITGQSKEIKIDSKNRIFIPNYTEVEAGEEISLMYDLYRKKLLILELKEFEDKADKFIKELDRLVKERKITPAKYRRYKRYFYIKLVLGNYKVDTQKRITIPESVIKKLDFDKIIYAVGEETHLELYKNKEAYQKSKTM